MSAFAASRRARSSTLSLRTASRLCGAPIVLNMLVHAPAAVRRALPHRVKVVTGGAAPPSAVIAGMEALGFEVCTGMG